MRNRCKKYAAFSEPIFKCGVTNGCSACHGSVGFRQEDDRRPDFCNPLGREVAVPAYFNSEIRIPHSHKTPARSRSSAVKFPTK